ncbi:hypothetical protein BaRGS_00029150 [Batillaria attramentaria]|uniref:Uncharacterized protein n=1 Tax=Batillaria attramentaria TaxID=370345 RepID=A0ABD0JX34_9CAEN
MFRRAQKKVWTRVLKLNSHSAGVMVGLLLAQIFYCNLIQLCDDVELNPGPPKSDQMRQTRLGSMKEGAENRRYSSGRSALDKELTLKDVFEKLAGMEAGIKQSLENLDLNIEEKLKNLKDEMLAEYATVQEKMRELREELQDFRQENEQLRSKLDSLYLKTDDLECRSRRNNVLIHGLPKADNETAEECEQTVQEFLIDKLELPETVQFDRVHRTSNKPNATISLPVVFCSRTKCTPVNCNETAASVILTPVSDLPRAGRESAVYDTRVASPLSASSVLVMGGDVSGEGDVVGGERGVTRSDHYSVRERTDGRLRDPHSEPCNDDDRAMRGNKNKARLRFL